MTHDQLQFDADGNLYAIDASALLATHRCPRCGYRWSPTLPDDYYESWPGDWEQGRRMSPPERSIDCPARGCQISEFDLEELDHA